MTLSKSYLVKLMWLCPGASLRQGVYYNTCYKYPPELLKRCAKKVKKLNNIGKKAIQLHQHLYRYIYKYIYSSTWTQQWKLKTLAWVKICIWKALLIVHQLKHHKNPDRHEDTLTKQPGDMPRVWRDLIVPLHIWCRIYTKQSMSVCQEPLCMYNPPYKLYSS